MGIDEAGQDQPRAVVSPGGLRIGGQHLIGGARRQDPPVLNGHSAAAVVPRGRVGRHLERIAGEVQNLSQKDFNIAHLGASCRPAVFQRAYLRRRPKPDAAPGSREA